MSIVSHVMVVWQNSGSPHHHPPPPLNPPHVGGVTPPIGLCNVKFEMQKESSGRQADPHI